MAARGQKNQVTLTFAGDASQLNKAFDDVGSSAKEMSGEVGSASKDMSDAGSRFDTAGGKIGDAEQKMRGFRDIVDGTGDVTRGFATGDISLLTKGFADIAAGSADLVVPALKKFGGWLKTTRVGILAQAAASKVARAASAVWTGVQWALNAALTANPIGIVVVAIGALVAAIILAWQNSETFRKIVKAAWEGIQVAIEAVVNWFTDTAWPAIQAVWDGIVSGVTWVRDTVVKAFNRQREIVGNIIDFFTGLPGKLRRGFSNLFDIITSPFKRAFNFVADAWNNTVGQLRWDVPDWVPRIGGNSVGAPKLPKFHTGGTVSGALGRETLAVLRAGERVTPSGGGGDRAALVLRSDGSRVADMLIELVMEALRTDPAFRDQVRAEVAG